MPQRGRVEQEAGERRHVVVGNRRRGVCPFRSRADKLRGLSCAGRRAGSPRQREELRQRTAIRAGAVRGLPCLPWSRVRAIRPQRPCASGARRQDRSADLRGLPSAARGRAGVGAGRPEGLLPGVPRRRREAARRMAAECGESSARRELLGLPRARRLAARGPAAPEGNAADERCGRSGAVRATRPRRRRQCRRPRCERAPHAARRSRARRREGLVARSNRAALRGGSA